jgi:hypothetical protein
MIFRQIPAMDLNGVPCPEGIVPSIHFCTGHDTRPIPGTQDTAFVHEYDPSKELPSLPKGSSVYPSDYFHEQEVLWQIAQEVAETDSTYVASVDFNDAPAEYFCIFCSGSLTAFARNKECDFPHDQDCLVTKARALIEQRKQTPQITVKITKDGELGI